eukprot:PhM_4_TR4870/c0_g1_i1/m.5197
MSSLLPRRVLDTLKYTTNRRGVFIPGAHLHVFLNHSGILESYAAPEEALQALIAPSAPAPATLTCTPDGTVSVHRSPLILPQAATDAEQSFDVDDSDEDFPAAAVPSTSTNSRTHHACGSGTDIRQPPLDLVEAVHSAIPLGVFASVAEVSKNVDQMTLNRISLAYRTLGNFFLHWHSSTSADCPHAHKQIWLLGADADGVTHVARRSTASETQPTLHPGTVPGCSSSRPVFDFRHHYPLPLLLHDLSFSEKKAAGVFWHRVLPLLTRSPGLPASRGPKFEAKRQVGVYSRSCLVKHALEAFDNDVDALSVACNVLHEVVFLMSSNGASLEEIKRWRLYLNRTLPALPSSTTRSSEGDAATASSSTQNGHPYPECVDDFHGAAWSLTRARFESPDRALESELKGTLERQLAYGDELQDVDDGDRTVVLQDDEVETYAIADDDTALDVDGDDTETNSEKMVKKREARWANFIRRIGLRPISVSVLLNSRSQYRHGLGGFAAVVQRLKSDPSFIVTTNARTNTTTVARSASRVRRNDALFLKLCYYMQSPSDRVSNVHMRLPRVLRDEIAKEYGGVVEFLLLHDDVVVLNDTKTVYRFVDVTTSGVRRGNSRNSGGGGGHAIAFPDLPCVHSSMGVESVKLSC